MRRSQPGDVPPSKGTESLRQRERAEPTSAKVGGWKLSSVTVVSIGKTKIVVSCDWGRVIGGRRLHPAIR